MIVSVDSSRKQIQPVDAKIITSSMDGKLSKVPVSYRPQTPVISGDQSQKVNFFSSCNIHFWKVHSFLRKKNKTFET